MRNDKSMNNWGQVIAFQEILLKPAGKKALLVDAVT